MKRSILIIIAVLLSGCASNDRLIKGELFYSKTQLQKEYEIEQSIKLDDGEIYTFTLFFD